MSPSLAAFFPAASAVLIDARRSSPPHRTASDALLSSSSAFLAIFSSFTPSFYLLFLAFFLPFLSLTSPVHAGPDVSLPTCSTLHTSFLLWSIFSRLSIASFIHALLSFSFSVPSFLLSSYFTALSSIWLLFLSSPCLLFLPHIFFIFTFTFLFLISFCSYLFSSLFCC